MNTTFPERLRALRESRGMSLAALGRACDASGQLVGQWEAGKCRPGFVALDKLATALGVSLDELVRGNR